MDAKPNIVKLTADDPRAGWYGESIANGRHVWAAYDDALLVCIAATVPEVKRLYRKAYWRFLNSKNLKDLSVRAKGGRVGISKAHPPTSA